MNIEEYIEKASQSISGKRQRLDFQREMRSHLEDRIEFYTDAGWDRETAIQKTLDRMGDPETVGNKMGRVHSNTASIVFDVLFVMASIVFAYYLFISYSIASPFTDFAGITGNVGGLNFLELYFICIVPALMLLTNRKGQHKVVMWILYLFSNSYIIFRLVSKYFCSPYLLKLYFVLSGHRSDLDLFNYSYTRYNGIPLMVISVVIMLVFWAAETAIIINSVSIDKHRNKKAVKRRTVYRRIFGTVLAAVIVFNTIPQIKDLAIDLFVPDEEENEIYGYDGIYVISSDEIKDFDELNYNEYELIVFDYDFVPGIGYAFWDKDYENWVLEKREFPNHGDINIEWIYQQSPVKNFEYAIQNIEALYKPSARYVAIVPYDNDRDAVYNRYDYSAAKWFDTQEADELYGVLNCFGVPELAYRISVN